ncbi:MAG: glycosyltransferase [Rhodospirillaceae bacterium]|nr:glycosyltransferase [Rhodospirillaceae bacterium]
MTSLTALAPTALVIAFFLALGLIQNRNARWVRITLLVVGIIVIIRYLPWRYAETVLPANPLTASGLWIWFLFAIELVFIADFVKHLLIRCRIVDRSIEADAAQQRLEKLPPEQWPSVDIFIPTYNEPLEVLERSILGSLAQDYPNFTVWVLDDGKRDWLGAFCSEHGVKYLTRQEHLHAKAGNLNNGFSHSSGEFVAVFDADFVPYKWFLRRVIGMFDNPGLGIIQTPQHFFNRDPVQQNLWIADMWPDEQRLFFDKLAPAMDAWDAMFCCGSCATYRRKAVNAIGGIPTASITEDILTTLEMLRKGYATRYLNERLSVGLAAESLEAFYVQRQRWCQGGIQALFLKAGPLGPGLDFTRRVLLFPIYWVFHIPARMIVLIIPALYFWFGLEPLENANAQEILFWQFPVLVAGWLSSIWYNGRQAYPIINDGPAALVAVRLLPVVISSLIRPFGRPFQVTPKGRSSEKIKIATTDVIVLGGLLAVNLVGFLANIPTDTRIVEQEGFLAVAGFWAIYNTSILAIAVLMSFESAARRIQERFPVLIDAEIEVQGMRYACTVTDMSLGGASILTPAYEVLKNNTPVLLDVSGIVDLNGRIVRRSENEIGIQFEPEPDGPDRTRMIEYLYTSGIDNAAQAAAPTALIWGLVKRLLGQGRSGDLKP